MGMVTDILRKLALSAAVLLLGTVANADEILLWMLEDPDIVGNFGVVTHISDPRWDASYARVAVIKSGVGYEVSKGFVNESDAIYLTMYNPDPPAGPIVDPETKIAQTFVDLVDPEKGTLTGYTATLYSLIGDHGGPTDGIRLAVELGSWVGEDQNTWVVAATSGLWDYNGVFHQNYVTSQVDIPTTTPWSPGAFSAPEPTSGLLMLLGGALLALRRRKNLIAEEA